MNGNETVVAGKLADFEEKTFIRSVLGKFAHTATDQGFDDCIVVDLAELTGLATAPYLVYSMDHPSRIKRPLPSGLDWRFYGRWVAACTCGDVIAMGATPRGFSLDLAVTLQTPVDVVEEFYLGLEDVLDAYGVPMEGGNLDIGTGMETVGFCWGTVGRDRIVRRRGAEPGDVVVVTTQPGIGWASYLLNRMGIWQSVRPDLRTTLTQYNSMPLGPLRPLSRLQDEAPGAVTSGMDLTDGLIEFLYTVANNNDVCVHLRQADLPVSEMVRELADAIGIPPHALLFEPGYDTPRIHGYTVKADKLVRAQEIFAAEGFQLLPIGEVTRGRGVTIELSSGYVREIPWFCDDQFRKDDLVERWEQVVGELFPAS